MRSFNDWYFDLFESGNGAYLNQQEIAEEAWQHQQSKVDELQVLYTQQGVNMLKLQKRVDELATAFNQLIEMESQSISTELDQFDKGWNQSARQTIENIFKLTGLGEQALKGEGL